MRIFHFVFICALCITFSFCNKKTPFTIDVSKITPTDETGSITGGEDNTDWTFDKDWNEAENAFFRTDPVDLTGMEVADITMLPAYPNPTAVREIKIRFTASAVTYFRIAAVNEQLTKRAFYNFSTVVGLNTFRSPFAEASFSANKNYRLYYSFEAPGRPMYYKGHGDVSIQ